MTAGAALRIGWAVLLLAVVSGSLWLPAVLSGLLDRSGRTAFRVARLWARLILEGLGVRVQVQGTENLPQGPALYAANHGSALDIPILFAHLPAEFRIIHKRSLYWMPVIGQYLYLGGHIGIDRSRAFRARRSLERAARRIAAGTSVAVFPEGTRSPDGSVRPFKRGSFVLAMNAGVPVVPVSLAGVKAVAPRGVVGLRPGTVRMTVHPALPTAGRDLGEVDRLAEEVREAVVAGSAA